MKKLSLGSAAIIPLFRKRGKEPTAAVKQVYKTLYGDIAPSLPAVEFSDGVLSLAARSAAWRKEGQRMAGSLISGLNHVLGGALVERIEFVSWRRSEKKPRPENKQSVKTQPSKELLAASRRIGNEHVRNAFVKFGVAVERGRDGQEQ